jgi:hypothetical protein
VCSTGVPVYGAPNINSNECARSACVLIHNILILDEDEQTIVNKMKARKRVPISKQEVLMMLRSYQIHPCSWKKIIENIRENDHQLPEDAQLIYRTNKAKQLKDRLFNKLSKLLSTPENKIQSTEMR